MTLDLWQQVFELGKVCHQITIVSENASHLSELKDSEINLAEST